MKKGSFLFFKTLLFYENILFSKKKDREIYFLLKKDNLELCFVKKKILKNHINTLFFTRKTSIQKNFLFTENILYTRETPEYYIYIYEFIPGVLLSNIIDKLSYQEAVFLFYKIYSNIKKIHNLNLIHGDLSPSNIIITKELEIKFIDSGFLQPIDIKNLNIIIDTNFLPPDYDIILKENPFFIDIYSIVKTFSRFRDEIQIFNKILNIEIYSQKEIEEKIEEEILSIAEILQTDSSIIQRLNSTVEKEEKKEKVNIYKILSQNSQKKNPVLSLKLVKKAIKIDPEDFSLKELLSNISTSKNIEKQLYKTKISYVILLLIILTLATIFYVISGDSHRLYFRTNKKNIDLIANPFKLKMSKKAYNNLDLKFKEEDPTLPNGTLKIIDNLTDSIYINGKLLTTKKVISLPAGEYELYNKKKNKKIIVKIVPYKITPVKF